MYGLSPHDLLDLIDRGDGCEPLERALLLVARAWPAATPEEGAGLPIGQRDALLIALRIATFGSAANLRATCPDCGEEMEADVDLAMFLAAHPPDDGAPQEHTCEHQGREIVFRLPTSADLSTIAALDADTAAATLMGRCLLAIDGQTIEPANGEHVSPEIAETLASAIAAADPLAEIELEVVCEKCSARAALAFDIVPFLWAEIEAAAHSLAQEVHALASAYGWSEDQVLALSPGRRALYLGLVVP